MMVSITISMLGCSAAQVNHEHSPQQDLKKPNTMSVSDKKFIVSYDMSYKNEILKALRSKNIEIIYDLKNMDILVIAIASNHADREVSALKNIQGILDIHEDSVISLD